MVASAKSTWEVLGCFVLTEVDFWSDFWVCLQGPEKSLAVFSELTEANESVRNSESESRVSCGLMSAVAIWPWLSWCVVVY
jgi:hypothetical protein